MLIIYDTSGPGAVLCSFIFKFQAVWTCMRPARMQPCSRPAWCTAPTSPRAWFLGQPHHRHLRPPSPPGSSTVMRYPACIRHRALSGPPLVLHRCVRRCAGAQSKHGMHTWHVPACPGCPSPAPPTTLSTWLQHCDRVSWPQPALRAERAAPGACTASPRSDQPKHCMHSGQWSTSHLPATGMS